MTRSQLRLWSPSSSPASPCVTAQSARGRASSAARPRAGAFAGERLQQHAASGCLDHLLCCALLLCRRPARELIMRPRARARGRAPACEAWHCEPSRLRHTVRWRPAEPPPTPTVCLPLRSGGGGCARGAGVPLVAEVVPSAPVPSYAMQRVQPRSRNRAGTVEDLPILVNLMCAGRRSSDGHVVL